MIPINIIAAAAEKKIHPALPVIGLLALTAICGGVFRLLGWSKPKKDE